MIFRESRLKGVWAITLEPHRDERGWFVRTFCENEFAAHALNTRWPQCNQTLTRARGAIRGLHFQEEPHPEIKLVRCLRGAIFDVVVDMRPDSGTYGQWEAFELSPAHEKMLYIGPGFAHGFQTLEPDSEVFYQMSDFFFPGLATGVRWDDPALGIRWPLPVSVISERDLKLPLFFDLAAARKSSGLTEKLD